MLQKKEIFKRVPRKAQRIRRRFKYIDINILKKVKKYRQEEKKKSLKIYNRSAIITPECVGITFEVHKGNGFTPVFVTEPMIDKRFGDFAPTRKFKGHAAKKK